MRSIPPKDRNENYYSPEIIMGKPYLLYAPLLFALCSCSQPKQQGNETQKDSTAIAIDTITADTVLPDTQPQLQPQEASSTSQAKTIKRQERYDDVAQAVAFQLFKSYDEQDGTHFDLLLCQSLWSKYKLTSEDIEELVCHALTFERDERSGELEMKLYKWHIQYPHYEYVINSLYCLFPELRQKAVFSGRQAETVCCERLGLPENNESAIIEQYTLTRGNTSWLSPVAPTVEDRASSRKKKKVSPRAWLLLSIFMLVFPLPTPITFTAVRHGGEGLLAILGWLIVWSCVIILICNSKKYQQMREPIMLWEIIGTALLSVILSVAMLVSFQIGIGTILLFLFGFLWNWATWKDMCIQNRTGRGFYLFFLIIFTIIACFIGWEAVSCKRIVWFIIYSNETDKISWQMLQRRA